MKIQTMRVQTKGALLAAIECSRESPFPSEISIVRKSGVTRLWLTSDIPAHTINKLKKKVKAVKATVLMA